MERTPRFEPEAVDHGHLVAPDGCNQPRPVGTLTAAVAVDESRLRAELRHELVAQDLVECGQDGAEREEADDSVVGHGWRSPSDAVARVCHTRPGPGSCQPTGSPASSRNWSDELAKDSSSCRTWSANPNSDPPPTGRRPDRAAHRLDQARTDEEADARARDGARTLRIAVEELEGTVDGGRRSRVRSRARGSPRSSPSCSARITTGVPTGVYLAALPRMFRTICST